MSDLFNNINFDSVRPIRDVVYDYLRTAIINGLIKPGERLVEKDYAEKFNISRTPVREALRKLEIEGLVENIPRKGDIVKGIALHDMLEIFAIRQALEPLIVKTAIDNMTPEAIIKLQETVDNMTSAAHNDDTAAVLDAFQTFHDILINVSNMPRLSAIISQLKDYLGRFRTMSLSNPTRRTQAISEHKEILQAIIANDNETAEQLISSHLSSARQSLLKKMQHTEEALKPL
ncbi:GntR family transcriptional regulator [Pelosinus sp. sgz500959]|uniref:GntR family transcriptional regulator n=1 Tax=Pelosinus sp. sgz500959 TaxID=3242472 RepID=UPI00366F24D3